VVDTRHPGKRFTRKEDGQSVQRISSSKKKKCEEPSLIPLNTVSLKSEHAEPHHAMTAPITPSIQRQIPATEGGAVRHQDRVRTAIYVKFEEFEAKKEEKDKVERREAKSPLDNLPSARRSRAHAWINSNIDPANGQGRKVFRRGCHPRCISTMLGGIGTDWCPLAKKSPPDYPPGSPNPFLQRGEFYFAGRGDWNPWGPVSWMNSLSYT